MAENAARRSRGSVATGRPVDNDRAIATKRAQNSKRSVNRLPCEILSNIFLIAEEEARSTRSKMKSYTTVQELASHVCSHWRNTAINSPVLWTYVHITRPPPQELAYLYLSRAGSTSLLHIDIDMRSKYWQQLNPGARKLARQERIREQTAPALQALSLKWKTSKDRSGERLEKNALAAHRQLIENMDSLPATPMPGLRHMELPSVSWGTLLGPNLNSQPFTGLTSLSLTSAYLPHSTSDLYNLLSHNPQLELLYIGHGVTPAARDVPTERIRLSFLRSLSIIGCSIAHWVLSILKMIDAPALQSLTIQAFDKRSRTHVGIAKYIATGHASAGQPIYPMLHELDISNFYCPNSELTSMLLALPSVTHLSLRGNQAEILDTSPWPLPNLDILTFPLDYHLDLCEVLRRREEAGFRVKTVGLTYFWSAGAEAELPGVQIIVNREFVAYCDCVPDDSESSSECECDVFDLEYRTCGTGRFRGGRQ